MTFAELLLEFYEDMYRRRDTVRSQLSEATNAVEIQQLQSGLETIEKVLRGDDAEDGLFTKTGDALIDEWLEDLESGRTPDLYAGLPEGVLERPEKP